MPSMRPRPLAAALGLLALVGCGGPVLVFPGGALEGPVEPPPESFAFARDVGTVQLETRPDDPYSVNINGTVVGHRPYVSAGGSRSQWVRHIEADPRVRLRVDGTIYELRAQRVTDEAEMRAFAAEWLKNAWARDPTKLDEAFVYRLEPR